MSTTQTSTRNLETSTILATFAITAATLADPEAQGEYLHGFYAWCRLDPMPTGDPVRALGWLNAARLNERTGWRPRSSDAAHNLTQVRAALATRNAALAKDAGLSLDPVRDPYTAT